MTTKATESTTESFRLARLLLARVMDECDARVTDAQGEISEDLFEDIEDFLGSCGSND